MQTFTTTDGETTVTIDEINEHPVGPWPQRVAASGVAPPDGVIRRVRSAADEAPPA